MEASASEVLAGYFRAGCLCDVRVGHAGCLILFSLVKNFKLPNRLVVLLAVSFVLEQAHFRA